MIKSKRNLALWVVFLAAAGIAPHVLGIVKTNVLVELAGFVLYAVSLNLLLSYTGVLSFGHALFYGVGAYTTALLLYHVEGFPVIGALLLSGLAAGVIGLILSPLLVRVTGTAFAMLTLAFGQLMFILCLKFREVTGGEDGIAGYDVPNLNIPGIASFDMLDPTVFYYFALAVCVIGVLIMWYITKTPLGQVVVGIRDNTLRVDYLGYKVPQTKAIVFAVSGFFAGIAGSLFALFQGIVSTDGVLHIMVSFYPIMAILIGGIGTFFGPILGSGVLIVLEDLIMRYTERAELITGLLFIGVVLYAPGGLLWLWRGLMAKLFGNKSQPASEEVEA
ncbi:branched-chain amino acid ABC transporter permease [Desulfatibacillum aliphaticivorans]|uniref:Inner-membrane translocator n=1 Tax=Desulfatibacillum aliphaticivorans TaxID=218208 RepID=B8FG06_DESAL|nr:branched-chain amino acid ABC transporter permease [Desulfatibacillum aliphaticivorans]ACL03686.1 inner-membrane translocator [Desulfatibacillum aliphaticivorans]